MIAALPEVATWLESNDLDGDDELLLRRVVDAGGRSRAYINGSPATVQQLREVGEWLVDIHGQHAHQSLLRGDAQRALLDAHAGLTAQGAGCRRGLESLARCRATTASLPARAPRPCSASASNLQWQIGELDALAFGEDEWATLDVEHRRLGHAASLIDGAQYALAVLAEDDAACERQIDSGGDPPVQPGRI
jgi:DNA repair protein RecN (Recombination protein N)